VDGSLDEVEQWLVIILEDVGWDRVNCQLYSGWRLGKRKSGIVSDGEGLVEAAGESIEVWGVGFCRGVWIRAGERDGISVVDFGYEAFGEERVGVGEGGGSDVGEGSGDALCNGVWGGVCSGSEEAP